MVVNVIGGRYRMLERHAVGGMATLWRARHERTGDEGNGKGKGGGGDD
jgi:hypothetical protein